MGTRRPIGGDLGEPGKTFVLAIPPTQFFEGLRSAFYQGARGRSLGCSGAEKDPNKGELQLVGRMEVSGLLLRRGAKGRRGSKAGETIFPRGEVTGLKGTREENRGEKSHKLYAEWRD